MFVRLLHTRPQQSTRRRQGSGATPRLKPFPPGDPTAIAVCTVRAPTKYCAPCHDRANNNNRCVPATERPNFSAKMSRSESLSSIGSSLEFSLKGPSCFPFSGNPKTPAAYGSCHVCFHFKGHSLSVETQQVQRIRATSVKLLCWIRNCAFRYWVTSSETNVSYLE